MEPPWRTIDYLLCCLLFLGCLQSSLKITKGRGFRLWMLHSKHVAFSMCVGVYGPIDACAGTSRRSLVLQGVIKYACGIANILCVNARLCGSSKIELHFHVGSIIFNRYWRGSTPAAAEPAPVNISSRNNR